MQKSVNVVVTLRDGTPENNIIGTQTAPGTTEDEGATVIVPLGYVPNVTTVDPSDVSVTVIPPPEVKTPESVQRVDDVEAGQSVLTIAYPAA